MKHHMGGLLLCIAVLAGCRRQHTAASLLPDTLGLQPGDVVFRRQTGLASRAVMLGDRRGIFSHTGIVVDSAGRPMVVHAVPGESRDGQPDRVRMESPQRFFAPGTTVAAGVYRPWNTAAGHVASAYAMRRYREGTLFDHAFNDEDTTRLYCTQLVILAYRHAGVQLTDSAAEVISLPSAHYRCILPSQLQQSPHLRMLFVANARKGIP